MNQFKNILILLIHITVICVAASEKNITGIILTIILLMNYIKLKSTFLNNIKIIKNEQEVQREYFINYLNHDIRIPTIAQIRALELLKKEKLGKLEDSQKDMMIQIEDSCKCVLNLVSLMINTYYMDDDKYCLNYEEFNLSEIINSCFDELVDRATDRQITFEYDNRINDNVIFADKNELKKVIFNILSTTVLNVPPGEKVSVTTCAYTGKIRLTFFCSNNYCYSNLYEPKNYAAVGQSLTMGFCKKIIESHNGKILQNKDSRNLFSFELPVSFNRKSVCTS